MVFISENRPIAFKTFSHGPTATCRITLFLAFALSYGEIVVVGGLTTI